MAVLASTSTLQPAHEHLENRENLTHGYSKSPHYPGFGRIRSGQESLEPCESINAFLHRVSAFTVLIVVRATAEAIITYHHDHHHRRHEGFWMLFIRQDDCA